eukprot:NODE_8250_length_696_cov_32.061082_g7628_i0.p1 GENE.NODE_8250_length_696_cov_32.061082_g7628_i0~~NODE_8250_length_696_cov_32.061082_g7628_i0.p1  ORF type:complete len:178 (-),score=41.57 NODE_8250_length_696_cov_32.061082_g7628_i0:162-653(-)
MVKTHALFDHFWLNAYRVLWREVELPNSFPVGIRTMESPGGFIWQFKYNVITDKRKEWDEIWKSLTLTMSEHLAKNDGFVEAKSYVSDNLHKTFQSMLTMEFLSLTSLSSFIFSTTPTRNFLDSMPNYCSDWNTVILLPPSDEQGNQIGYFYPAAGADQNQEL